MAMPRFLMLGLPKKTWSMEIISRSKKNILKFKKNNLKYENICQSIFLVKSHNQIQSILLFLFLSFTLSFHANQISHIYFHVSFTIGYSCPEAKFSAILIWLATINDFSLPATELFFSLIFFLLFFIGVVSLLHHIFGQICS